MKYETANKRPNRDAKAKLPEGVTPPQDADLTPAQRSYLRHLEARAADLDLQIAAAEAEEKTPKVA